MRVNFQASNEIRLCITQTSPTHFGMNPTIAWSWSHECETWNIESDLTGLPLSETKAVKQLLHCKASTYIFMDDWGTSCLHTCEVHRIVCVMMLVCDIVKKYAIILWILESSLKNIFLPCKRIQIQSCFLLDKVIRVTTYNKDLSCFTDVRKSGHSVISIAFDEKWFLLNKKQMSPCLILNHSMLLCDFLLVLWCFETDEHAHFPKTFLLWYAFAYAVYVTYAHVLP